MGGEFGLAPADFLAALSPENHHALMVFSGIQ